MTLIAQHFGAFMSFAGSHNYKWIFGARNGVVHRYLQSPCRSSLESIGGVFPDNIESTDENTQRDDVDLLQDIQLNV